jgi:hypothetical protein
MRRLIISLAATSTLLLSTIGMAPIASAHGCTYTLGFYKNKLDNLLQQNANFPIPFPATGNTQQERLNSAVAILSYSGSDPVAKLEKQFMASALTLASGTGDMQSNVFQQYLAAQSFLQSYLANPTTLSAAQKQQVLDWASLLDQYNNGQLGTPHCS